MSAAIIDKGATTWFFKMMGPREVVENHRETFQDFLGTVKLPAGS
jgi:hypothetical protein